MAARRRGFRGYEGTMLAIGRNALLEGDEWAHAANPEDKRALRALEREGLVDIRRTRERIAGLQEWWFRLTSEGRRAAGVTERDRARPTRRQERLIHEKIPILRHEGYPQRQSIAIAYRMAGVPPRRGGRRRDPERERLDRLYKSLSRAGKDYLDAYVREYSHKEVESAARRVPTKDWRAIDVLLEGVSPGFSYREYEP